MRQIALTSLLIGLFFAVFVGGVDAVTSALSMWQLIGLGGVSVLMGSFFSQLATRRKQ